MILSRRVWQSRLLPKQVLPMTQGPPINGGKSYQWMTSTHSTSMRTFPPIQVSTYTWLGLKTILILHFEDRSAVTRLLHIAQHCPTLAPSALLLALQYILQSSNTGLYMSTIQEYNNLPSITDPLPIDQKWIDEVSTRNASEKNRLEVELRQYASNMIKESIRVRDSCIRILPKYNTGTNPDGASRLG